MNPIAVQTVTTIERSLPFVQTKKRVAAYARISMETERMNHSLSTQVSYYNELIQRNPKWEFAGVYVDEGISGTSIKKRKGFQDMLANCRAGLIDIVLTKSIQRFARNTVDLLQTVRELKALGIEVFFEKENIRTLSGDGELMLSILASFAQEESRSISENLKWYIHKSFEQGKAYNHICPYGYRWDDDELVIVPEEAEVIRRIFREAAEGRSKVDIANDLNKDGFKTRRGAIFRDSSIWKIISNITYTGNLMLQKTYSDDAVVKKRKVNHGELPRFYVENHHEAIVDMELFNKAEEMTAIIKESRRSKVVKQPPKPKLVYCFTDKLICGCCGFSFHRFNIKGQVEWHCPGEWRKGSTCTVKNIPESILKQKCNEVLVLDAFDESIFHEKVKQIIMREHNVMEFHLTDGTIFKTTWVKERKQRVMTAWTPERRAAYSAEQKRKQTRHSLRSPFTAFIRCGKCGENYRACKYHYADGSTDTYRRCRSSCGNQPISEDSMKDLVCYVLGLDEFSEKKMDEALDCIVMEDKAVTFNFLDGHKETIPYEFTPRPFKMTDVAKAKIGRLAKERWRKSNENNENTGCA